MSPDIKEKIIKEISELSDDFLVEIDRMIQEHKKKISKPFGKKRFEGLFGSISEQDAKEMLDAIEDFEGIDLDEW